MEREIVEIIGIVAGCCTTASFVPQVIRTWRTRSVADISLRMYLLLCLGVSLWLVYGALIGSPAVLLANAATLLLAAAILGMKLVFGRAKGRPPGPRR
ncbi:SemiSWEET family sugar transporter [Pseudodesulfovibrio pelocollis]|uniref:SemiSWEET family sugar transporter n=1 Tax=Pseudodesulfovibrio pelocollis TaxID=3051432 RepID=UPI00255AD3E4|nr:SemiSWEET transporter [Pseudodesulfovibrio sp. SB368]